MHTNIGVAFENIKRLPTIFKIYFNVCWSDLRLPKFVQLADDGTEYLCRVYKLNALDMKLYALQSVLNKVNHFCRFWAITFSCTFDIIFPVNLRNLHSFEVIKRAFFQQMALETN